MSPEPATAEAGAAKVKPLAAAETAVRRLLLMVGFGFAAFVGGSILAVSLTTRIATRLEGSSDTTRLIAGFLIECSWVIVALPAIGYLAARFLEVKPWPTAIIGAGTGVLFQVALQYVSSGAEGLTGEPARQIGRLLGTALGVVLTATAVRHGRELAKISEAKARLEAEKKKTQYDEFVRQAEALAERREQVPIAPPVTALEPVKPEDPKG
ncbi:MAG: hypothetical protein IPJ65_08660 [Archangiaceae bacterium]|nr:hypothetical protein [Archangiaceae bacterium]